MKYLNDSVNRSSSSSISIGSRGHGLPRGVKAGVMEDQVLQYVKYLTCSVDSSSHNSSSTNNDSPRHSLVRKQKE